MKASARMKVDYDDIGDVLYITASKITQTKNDEDEAGLVLRYDLATKRPVGATVIDFKEYWQPRRKHLAERIAGFFGVSVKQAEEVIHAAD